MRDVFGGNSRTSVITNVLSQNSYYFETWNTLRFAAKAKSIKTSPKANFETEGTEEALKQEINHLLRRIDELEKGEGKGWAESDNGDNQLLRDLVQRLEIGWDSVFNTCQEQSILNQEVLSKADDTFVTLIMDFRGALARPGSDALIQTKFVPVLEDIEVLLLFL